MPPPLSAAVSPESPSLPPRIRRFESLAFGLFIHYGLFSLPARGEWSMHHERIPASDYRRLLPQFTAERFNACSIARLARLAGMRYACLTTRHHEGFSLYDTRGLSDFDAPHAPAGRDLVAEFVEACRAEGIVPFLYHTTLDWSRSSHECPTAAFRDYLAYLRASVEILCREYGPLGGLWFDGNWSRRDQDWEEDALYALIRRHQPDCMIINNSGLRARGAMGHPELDAVTFEQSLPGAPDAPTSQKRVAREMCRTLNRHWGAASHDLNYIGVREAIEILCACRKVGSNLLLNCAPRADGDLEPYEHSLLEKVGQWIDQQRAPIYEGRPTRAMCQGRDFLLGQAGSLFYFAHDLPRRGSQHVVLGEGADGPRVIKGITGSVAHVRWIDTGEDLHFSQCERGDMLTIDLTGYPYGRNAVVRVAEIAFDPV